MTTALLFFKHDCHLINVALQPENQNNCKTRVAYLAVTNYTEPSSLRAINMNKSHTRQIDIQNDSIGFIMNLYTSS